MSDFVRGGQLWLHSLRMLEQVIKPVLICAVLIWMLFTVALIHRNSSVDQIGSVKVYVVSQLYSLIGLGKTKVNWATSTSVYRVKAYEILNNSYIKESVEEFKEIAASAAMMSSIITAFISILIALGLTKIGKNKVDPSFKRGASLADTEDVKKQIIRANKRDGYLNPYYLADVPYPRFGETEHTIVVGTTGVGKTVLISDIVEQIRRRGDKAIIFDTKGGFVEWFYDKGKDFILNPFDARSQNWNLLSEVKHVAHIKSVAEAFIPRDKSKNNVWSEAGRIAFAAIVEKLLNSGDAHNITNSGLVDLIMRQSIKEVEKLAKGTYAQSIIDSTIRFFRVS